MAIFIVFLHKTLYEMIKLAVTILCKIDVTNSESWIFKNIFCLESWFKLCLEWKTKLLENVLLMNHLTNFNLSKVKEFYNRCHHLWGIRTLFNWQHWHFSFKSSGITPSITHMNNWKETPVHIDILHPCIRTYLRNINIPYDCRKRMMRAQSFDISFEVFSF